MKAWNCSWACLAALIGGCMSYPAANLPVAPPQEPEPDHRAEIRSIQFVQNGNQNIAPVLFLGGNDRIELHFDMTVSPEHSVTEFEIMMEACDQAWNKTGEQPMTFYNGFLPDRLDLPEDSRGTRIPYRHYQYSIPTQGYSFTKSGNYLLTIRERLEPEQVAFQKRLIVVENIVPIEASVGAAARVQDRASRQRVDFSANLGGMQGGMDPLQDISATVLRNMRFQDSEMGLQATFFDGNRLDFRSSPGEEGLGGASFRVADLSQPGFAKYKIPFGPDSIPYIILPKEKPFLARRPEGRFDQNGGFMLGGVGLANGQYHGEYLLARFRLGLPSPLEGKVYVTGGFCGWRLDEENELAFDPMHSEYSGDVLLKQGIYDYAFAIKGEDGQTDYSYLEGETGNTQNLYTILLYLHGPSDQGERCVGIRQIEFR